MEATGRIMVISLIGIIMTTLVSPASATWCSRVKCGSVRVRVCSYRTWQGCCAYKYVWKSQYRKERFCCSGWTGSNCNTPICNPPCQNGGTCSAPNTCNCPLGRTGATCTDDQFCSFRKPCYPGNCSSSSGECTCQSGFDTDSCVGRQEMRDQLSQVWLYRTTLLNIERSIQPVMMTHELVLDSSNPTESSVEILWSNQLQYNYLKVEALGQFEPQNILPRPSYVDDSSEFGIGNSTITLTHERVTSKGSLSKPDVFDFNCQRTDGTTSEFSGIWNCTYLNQDFKQKIQSGETFNFTIMFESGGNRKIRNPITGLLVSNTFTPLPSYKTVVYRFDSIEPKHCSELPNNCKKSPLDVKNDITKTAVEIDWDGWEDQTSGMHRYTWEIFKLEVVDNEGRLGEKKPLNPLHIKEVFDNNLTLPITYLPPEPGMYSVILEASDLANNSVYARQLFLYDDQSSIELKSEIKVLTSANISGSSSSTWQSNFNDVIFDWSGHFINSFHVSESLLNEVITYPTQFATTMGSFNLNLKYVKFDDETGKRNQSRIPNIDGIVHFRVSGVVPLKRLLQTNYTVKSDSLDKQDGSSVELKVEAEDALGNTVTDVKTVYFDTSLPQMTNLTKVDTDMTNTSRISFETFDLNSGIHEIKWRLMKRNLPESAKEEIRNGTLPVLSETSNGQGVNQTCLSSDNGCYCSKDNQCYKKEFILEVNHCWFRVGRQYLDTASVQLEVDSINPAGLSTLKTHTFSGLRDFLQNSSYFPPTDLQVYQVGPNSATLNWTSIPSCFPVSEFWLLRSDRPGKEKIHRLTRLFEISNLQPVTSYTVNLIAGYDGDMSDNVTIIFVTAAKAEPLLSVGAKAGIGIGVILLIALIVLVVLVFLYVNGLVFGRYSKHKLVTEKAPERARFDGDEDIYMYGVTTGDIPVDNIISGTDLVLEEQIDQGKFAKIYKASVLSKIDKTVVAAKMLLDNFTDDEKRMMCGKIAFMSDVVGEHPNVLKFIGAVLDNDVWGPTMVTEFCELGTLLSWLHKSKEKVDDEILERLFQIAFGVVNGMAYLASLNVVHKRLACRNILLTFILEPKITGFGPSVIDMTDSDKKERVPIRWVAPECFSTTKNATERSDVWSFGIVLYELFSLGDQPYPTLSTQDVMPKVSSGYKMNQPELANKFNYDMMLQCWELVQTDRPRFDALQQSYNVFMNGESQPGEYSNYSNNYTQAPY